MINLNLQQVCFSYSNGIVLNDINLSIERGQMVGLLGPNGSGKTTLIKLVSGILRPQRGSILLDYINIDQLSRNTIAQKVAVVPQQFNMPFSFTVNDLVMFGRTPFIKLLAGEKETDRRAVSTTMEIIGIDILKHRLYNELSGGEQQKTVLAMAMAQQPGLLLLDEPTTHLDINHQTEILSLVQQLNKEQGITVIAALHDLNLAAMYFDRLIILKDGSIFADGSPVDVLTEDIIGKVFNAPVHITNHPATGKPYVVLLPVQKN